MRRCRPVACAALLGLALPARAEVDLATVDACVADSIASERMPTACVDAALAECIATPDEAPALATLCFTTARAAFSDGISAQMDRIRASADDKIAAIAGIEVKYDLLASLVQCDRMEELALLTDRPGEEIARQKIRCAATASGLAYIRLIWRAKDLP